MSDGAIRTIEIDAELHAYLVSQISSFGETPSSVLRRLLKLRESRAKGPSSQSEQEPTSSVKDDSLLGSDLKLREWLETQELTWRRQAVDRFLKILSFVYKLDPREFQFVEEIKGTQRKYFARSREELESTGKHVNPKPIPDSPFWVVTNNDTAQKMEILARVMDRLGFDQLTARAALAALNRSDPARFDGDRAMRKAFREREL